MSSDDWRATLRLHDHHLRSLWAYPAECLQLRKRFPHRNDSCAASRRVNDDVWQAVISPTTLLCKFDSYRLLAFQPVRFLESGQIEPAARRRLLGDQAT